MTFQRTVVLSYSGSVTPRRLAATQEYYIGMDNKDDGKPWGALLHETLSLLTDIFCSSDRITRMEVKLYGRVFYK